MSNGDNLFQDHSGGGDSLFQDHGSGVTRAPKKSGGGGVFGFIGREATKFASNIDQAARKSPGGLFEAGKAIAHDVQHPFTFSHSQTLPLVAQTGKSILEDVRHPLRNPGFTFLDALAVADPTLRTILRARAATGALRSGEGVTQAVKGVTRPKPLVMTAGGVSIQRPLSKAPLRRAKQVALNKALEKAAASKPTTAVGAALQAAAEARQLKRVSKAIDKKAVAGSLEARSNAIALLSESRKLSDAQQTALRVNIEEVPLAERLAKHESDLASAQKSTQRARIQRKITLLQEAAQFLEKDGVTLKNAALRSIVERASRVADTRKDLLVSLGLLDPGRAVSRLSAPGAVFRGATFDKKTGKLGGGEGFSGGKFRVPMTPEMTVRGAFTRAPRVNVASGTLAGQGSLATLRHPFTEASIKSATFADKAVRQIALDALQAERFRPIAFVRRILAPHLKALPESPNDIFVRLEPGGKLLPAALRTYFAHDPIFFQGVSQQNALKNVFLKPQQELTPVAKAQLEALNASGKGGFIDGRLLGKIAEAPFVLPQGFRKFLGPFDTINTATKAAILYVKPAYLVPNLVGNVALNIAQQGYAAPANISRAVKIGEKDGSLIDLRMSGGFSHATAAAESSGSVGRSAISSGVAASASKAADFWGNFIDVPFRRASFIFEARRAGFRSTAEIHDLLTNPKLADDLQMITERATDAIIDYASLTPVERAVIARVIFFYPWIKGSTRYAAQFWLEHPLEAGIAGQLGVIGEKNQASLGQLPSFFGALIRVGTAASGNPEVVNPQAAAILQQPADVARAALGFATGRGIKSSLGQAAGLATPATNILLQAATGHTDIGTMAKGGVPGALADQARSVPIVKLIRQEIAGRNASKLTPTSRNQALLRFLVGQAFGPAELNRAKSIALARRGR